MTTATQSKPSTTSAPAHPKFGRVVTQGDFPLSIIDVREQVRKKFDEHAHKELTESVRTKGVISPVTLRPKGSRYELVAGERRYRAAKAAGLTSIPAIVRELDDHAAALYQVEENIHRKDLTHIEEARGFKLLTQPVKDEPAKYSVEALAQLVDKSSVYVYRALRLLELPARILEKIEKGELTPAHGHQLLRVAPEQREETFKKWKDNTYEGEGTAKDLEDYIDSEFGTDLNDALFPKNKAFAGMEACTTCPMNSGNQGQLFDGAEKGKCLKQSCFDAKTKHFIEEQAVLLKEKYPEAKVYKVPHNVWKGHFVAGHVVMDPLKKDQKLKANEALVISENNGSVFIAQYRRSSPASESSGPKPKGERERFVENAVQEHIERVTGLAKKEASEKAMLAVINANYDGRRLDAETKKLLPVTAKNAVRAFYLDVIESGYVYGNDLYKALGIDEKKERATAAKKAEEQWLKEHPKAAKK